jgi:hypothetical protein
MDELKQDKAKDGPETPEKPKDKKLNSKGKT